MRRRYNLPTDICWNADPGGAERARIERVIRASLQRAVENRAGEEERAPVDLADRQEARDRFSPLRSRPERETYLLPSYDGGGTHKEAPVIPSSQAGGDAKTEDGPPDWVLSILGDRQLSLTTKLSAMAAGAGFAEFEPKSEDEFVKDLLARQASDPDAGEAGLSSEEAGKQLTEQIIRSHAVDKAMSLMGADWHAPVDSAAYKTARGLHKGDPQDARSKALKGGLLWAFENQDALQKIKEEALRRYTKTKSDQAREVAEAADGLLTAVGSSLNAPLSERQYSPADADFAETAWRYPDSEKSKKYLEKVGFPLAWFTTCVTLVNPVAEAAGVDIKKWSPLDMFFKNRQERFKEAQSSHAWVPAEKKEQPKPGDILIFVTYQKDKGVPQKEISKATFQHVAILVEPVTTNTDGTERWVTADGGKGSSHAGEDKTGITIRRYNPVTQQFITEKQTNLQEAAEGGRYLLGFWSMARLPRRANTPPKTGAK